MAFLRRHVRRGGSIGGPCLVWVGAVLQQQFHHLCVASPRRNVDCTLTVVGPCLVWIGIALRVLKQLLCKGQDREAIIVSKMAVLTVLQSQICEHLPSHPIQSSRLTPQAHVFIFIL